MSTLLSEQSDTGVLTITLNRPEVFNAFNDTLIAELTATLHAAANNDNTRLVVLQGNGKHFCSGADLAWMQQMANYSYEENLHDAKQLARLFHTLYSLPKPTLAKIHGASFGGALGLIACCDCTMASDTASFCFSEVKLGLIPATIAPFIINTLGPRQSRRLFLTAERFTAQQAQALGFIDYCVPAEELDDHCKALAQSLLANGSAAMTAIKALTQQLAPISESTLLLTATAIANVRSHQEAQQRLLEFLHKGTCTR